MPSLENLHQQFKNDAFTFMAVDVGEKMAVVQKFIEKKGYSFINILDEDKDVSALYGVISHPMKFLINKNGELIGFAMGYRQWDSDEMKLLINLLIKS